jgi:hypothetical protein
MGKAKPFIWKEYGNERARNVHRAHLLLHMNSILQKVFAKT